MSRCQLPGCNKKARRKFCSNKHKDRFHNLNNPRGRFAHLTEPKTNDQYYLDSTHPFDSDALGQD